MIGRVAVVATTLFLDMLGYGLVVPVIPVGSARLGAGAAPIGLMFASYGLALFLMTPVLGAIAGRMRRRTLLVLGLAGLAASTTLFGLATTLATLVAARILQGAAAAASWVAGLALLAEGIAPERRGRAFGIVSAASALGILLGPPLGGWLADGCGPCAPFMAVAAAAAAWALVALAKLNGREPPRPSARTSAATLLGDRGVRAVCVLVVAAAALLGVLEPMLPLDLATRLGASPGAIGTTFAASTIAYGLASVIVGWAGARRPRSIGRAGWIGAAVVFPLLAVPRSMALQLLLMAVFGATLALMHGPLLRRLAVAVDSVGGDHGVAYAAYNAAYAVGIMLGAGLGGALASELGVGRGLAVTAAILVPCGVIVAGQKGE
jgi:predicted MFS family arabinose efflux permease